MKRKTSYFSLPERLFGRFLTLILITIFTSNAFLGTASSMSTQDLSDILNGHPYYSADAEVICTTSPKVPSGGLKPNAKTFVIGDSLTYGMTKNGDLLGKLGAAGFSVDTNYTQGGTNSAPRVSGHSVEATGGIRIANTLPLLDAHVDDIGLADAIIVGLGTNRESGDFVAAINSLVTKIRSAPFNSKANIYWINTYYTGNLSTAYATVNEEIDRASRPNDQRVFEVFDIAAAIGADSALSPNGGDGVHYSPSGYLKRSDWVVEQLKTKTGQPSESDPSTGLPTTIDTSGITWGTGVWASGSTQFVSNNPGPYTREYWAISVLKNIARKANIPESTMVTPSKVLAMIAFAVSEGGGITLDNGRHTNGTYNPLNKKGVYDDIPGENQGNASNDSNSTGYTTFDYGVEAITRGLFGSYQKRIGSTLLDPGMSASQLMLAETGNFYTEGGPTSDASKVRNGWEAQFPGDKIWATASITGYIYDRVSYDQNHANGIGDHDAHLKTKMQVLERVSKNYEASAGVLLDLPNRVSDTRPAPTLTYSTADMTGLATAIGGGGGCNAAAIGGPSQNIPMTIGGFKKPDIQYDFKTNMTYPGCNFDGTQPAGAVKGEQPGAKEIQKLLDSKWGGGTGYIFNCREMSGHPGVPSLHGTGRAVDSMHNVTNPTELENGNKTLGWLVANAEKLGMQYAKFWRVQWTPNKGFYCVTDAADQSVHSTHVHWELNWDGALKKSPHFNGQPADDSMVEINQELCPKL